jgi:hypothetical protein
MLEQHWRLSDKHDDFVQQMELSRISFEIALDAEVVAAPVHSSVS